MAEVELDENLLEVCQPSELRRRDSALVRRGTPEEELALAQETIASLGLSELPAPPSTKLRDRLLASVRRPGRFGVYADRLARMFEIDLAEAERLAERIGDPTAYNPFFVSGVEVLEVPIGPRLANGGAIAVIAKLQPGTRFPAHEHHGEELMFLLAGGFREEGEAGREVWRGDELVSSDKSEHAFVALEGEPCIAASLVEGFVDFR